MKTTIIEILNKIANGEEPPKKIKYADEVLEYDGYKIDYVDSDGDGLFNEYAWITELNDEVEILETTITYKPDKIEKLEDSYTFVLDSGEVITRSFTMAECVMKNKINEIIEVINER